MQSNNVSLKSCSLIDHHSWYNNPFQIRGTRLNSICLQIGFTDKCMENNNMFERQRRTITRCSIWNSWLPTWSIFRWTLSNGSGKKRRCLRWQLCSQQPHPHHYHEHYLANHSNPSGKTFTYTHFPKCKMIRQWYNNPLRLNFWERFYFYISQR
jgi:hypothetical protein